MGWCGLLRSIHHDYGLNIGNIYQLAIPKWPDVVNDTMLIRTMLLPPCIGSGGRTDLHCVLSN